MAGGRFWRRGITRFFFVPTIASTALVPTAAEVNAGTELTKKASPGDESLKAPSGFGYTNQPIPVPDWTDTFTATITGEDQVAASSVQMYEGKTSNPARTAMAKGTLGYIVIFPAGTAGTNPAAGDKADVWPVQSAGGGRNYDTGNEAASYHIDFGMTGRPADTVTLT